jgi:hypothetical protein
VLTRFQLVGIALAAGFVCALIAQKPAPLPVTATTISVATPAGDSAPVDAAALQAAHDRETKVRIQELTRLQDTKTRRELAAEKMLPSRKFLQLTYAGRWSTVLTTNWPTFMELRRQAFNSPNQEVFCTICGGTERLPYCIVCSGNQGKCVSCRGTGRTSVDEICPTCLGNRKCFLCSGSGKMSCPFCIEGMVNTRRPAPSNQLPIE